jgi:hypothetical protein
MWRDAKYAYADLEEQLISLREPVIKFPSVRLKTGRNVRERAVFAFGEHFTEKFSCARSNASPLYSRFA